jgi:hypothetical protein
VSGLRAPKRARPEEEAGAQALGTLRIPPMRKQRYSAATICSGQSRNWG